MEVKSELVTEPAALKIQLLSEEVINQIAAGEVIERPASVLKELVDNSLDANARNITIHLYEGGLKSLIVTDDGDGISAADLDYAVIRHATSKLTQFEDLWNIQTQGFRGEALASIAAVAELSITSAQHNGEGALKKVFYNQNFPLQKCVAPKGTQICVQNLFGNVPVRKKFVSQANTEFRKIYEWLQKIALTRYDVGFKVFHNNEEVLFYPQAASVLERIKLVLKIKENTLFKVQEQIHWLQVEAYLNSPADTASTSAHIHLMVNNRPVQDKGLLMAVRNAYWGTIPENRFAKAVLFLKFAPGEVDINVHPNKTEVRFSQSGAVFDFIRSRLGQIIRQNPWVKEQSLNFYVPSEKLLPQADSSNVSSTFKNTPATVQASLPHSYEADRTFFKTKNFASSDLPQAYPSKSESITQSQESWVSYVAPQGINTHPEIDRSSVTTQQAPQPTNSYYETLQVIGQLHLTYIVAQDQNNLVLLDQHAVAERIGVYQLQQEFKKKLHNQNKSQALLLPLAVTLTPAALADLQKAQFFLKTLSIEFEIKTAEQQLLLTHQPLYFKTTNWQHFFDELSQVLQEISAQPDFVDFENLQQNILLRDFWEQKLAPLFACDSCHHVIRAGQALSHAEMQALIAQLKEVDFNSNCPHGRPLFLQIPLTKIETQLGRS